MRQRTITITISEKVNESLLKLLAARQRGDVSDAMRRALNLYVELMEHTAKGGTVNLVNADGTGELLRVT